MSRPGLPSLDHEPKKLNVPPPSYRSTVIMDTDTWSQYSASSAGIGKRRNSWTNLVESDENLTKHKVNCYPKVTTPFKQPSLSSASSVASDFQTTEVFRQFVPRGSLPVLADPSHLNVRPAGSLPPISRGPSKAPSVAMSPMPGSTIPPKTLYTKTKRNRLQEWKKKCCRPMVGLCCLLLILTGVVGAIIAIVLSQVLPAPDRLTFQMYPPSMVSQGQNQSSNLQMSAKDDQVKFQLQGALPFKGNYISYYDFKTNKVVIIDESLKSNGRSLACFVIPLDRNNLQDSTAMRKAASATKSHNHMTTGWQETWTWIPSPMTTPPVFNPPIKECEGARWIQLDQTSIDQQTRKCSDCYDFCLPDYGIARDTGNNYLNVMRRDCFYLFVPEWRSYAQANSIDQNQRDFESYYRNRVHLTPSYGGPNGESKWIPLSIPRGMQNVLNQTGQAIAGSLGNIGNTLQNVAQGVRTSVFGSNSQPGLFGNMVNNMGQPSNQNYPQQPDTGVTGVINQHGVNENTGNTLYQTGPTINGQVSPGQAFPSAYSNPPGGINSYGQQTGGVMGSVMNGQSQQYNSQQYGSTGTGYPGSNVNAQVNQMTGVNPAPVVQGYPGQISNLDGQHHVGQQASVPTNPQQMLGRSGHMAQELNSQHPNGFQNPTTLAGAGGYSSDVVHPPSRAGDSILASLQAQAMNNPYRAVDSHSAYKPDNSGPYGAQVQGIAGMEVSRPQGGNGYSPNMVNSQNSQPTGRWIRN